MSSSCLMPAEKVGYAMRDLDRLVMVQVHEPDAVLPQHRPEPTFFNEELDVPPVAGSLGDDDLRRPFRFAELDDGIDKPRVRVNDLGLAIFDQVRLEDDPLASERNVRAIVLELGLQDREEIGVVALGAGNVDGTECGGLAQRPEPANHEVTELVLQPCLPTLAASVITYIPLRQDLLAAMSTTKSLFPRADVRATLHQPYRQFRSRNLHP